MLSQSTASRKRHAPETLALEADVQRRCLAALCDVNARRAILGLAALGLVIFAPLAMSTRSGLQIAALLVLVLGSGFHWVTSWHLDQQLLQPGTPSLFPMALVCSGLTGLGWALCAAASLLQSPITHAGAIAMAATFGVMAASLWLLASHRHACRAFVAPMAILPVAALFAQGTHQWGLAALTAAALAAVVMLAAHAERAFVQRTVNALRLRTLSTTLHKSQRDNATASVGVSARDADQALLFDHAAVGLAAVVDRKIESINEHLAHMLKQAPEDLVGKDALHLIEREFRDAVAASAQSRNPARDAVQARLNLGPQTEGRRVEVITAAAGSGSRLWVFKDLDAMQSSATTKANSSVHAARVLDRHGLKEALNSYALRTQDLAIVVIALHGWHALATEVGIADASSLLQTTAQRLQSVCRADDHVARMEGETFVVLLAAELSETQVLELCVRLGVILEAPHTLNDRRFHMEARVEPVRCQAGMHQPAAVAAMIDEALNQVRTSSGSLSADATDDAPRIEVRPDASVKAMTSPKPVPVTAQSAPIELISLAVSQDEDEVAEVEARPG